jgi:DTW domain-containing protein YfiP
MNFSLNKDFELRYIIISRDKKVEKKCTLYPLRGRSDFSFRTRKEPGEFSSKAILLFPNGETLTPEHVSEIKNQDPEKSKLEIVLIDSRWKKTKGVLDLLPLLRKVSLEGYNTGAIRRDPPPQGGLASVEALYLASQIFGKPDLSLLENYHFRRRFFEINKMTIPDMFV